MSIPESIAEIFESYQPEDVPLDCHRHCTCYWGEGECCACGEKISVENGFTELLIEALSADDFIPVLDREA